MDAKRGVSVTGTGFGKASDSVVTDEGPEGVEGVRERWR